jgi:hypothetical protein
MFDPDRPWQEKTNKDGTRFLVIPPRDLHVAGCVLVHTIDDLPGKHNVVTRSHVQRGLESIQSTIDQLALQLGMN